MLAFKTRNSWVIYIMTLYFQKKGIDTQHELKKVITYTLPPLGVMQIFLVTNTGHACESCVKFLLQYV